LLWYYYFSLSDKDEVYRRHYELRDSWWRFLLLRQEEFVMQRIGTDTSFYAQTANLAFPTSPTARQIGTPWGGVNKSLYPASIGHRHTGYDLLAPTRSPIYAVASGVVAWAGYEQAHGYGRHVYIAHEIGGIKFHTGYAHLRRVDVKAGESVTAGQQIGTQGGDLWDALRGASLGAHLHFEVVLPEKPERDHIKTYRGYTVHPLEWLSDSFLPAPRYTGKVISKDGNRLRLFPEVSARALRVGALEHESVRGFAERLISGDDVWLRLSTLRTVWTAAKYRGEKLIDYTENTPPESDDEQQNAYIQRTVRNLTAATLDEAIALLEKKKLGL
jgi:hypothetical protein